MKRRISKSVLSSIVSFGLAFGGCGLVENFVEDNGSEEPCRTVIIGSTVDPTYLNLCIEDREGVVFDSLREGKYEVLLDDGRTLSAEVYEGDLFIGSVGMIDAGGYGFNSDEETYGRRFGWSDTRLVGDNCIDCHCPQRGIRLDARIVNGESFSGTLIEAAYCVVSDESSFTGRFIGDE